MRALGAAALCSCIVVSAGDSVLLVDGVPQMAVVEAEAYVQFQMPLAAGFNSTLRVAVMPSFGDPDLYATLNGTEPSSGNWEYMSKRWWTVSEQVVIRPGDPAPLRDCLTEPCTLKLAVYGAQRSEFEVVATSTSAATQLLGGAAYSGVVRAGVPAYFDLLADAAAGGSFALSPLAGAPALYADCGKDVFPTAESHKWALHLNGSSGGLLSVSGGAAAAAGCSTEGGLELRAGVATEPDAAAAAAAAVAAPAAAAAATSSAAAFVLLGQSGGAAAAPALARLGLPMGGLVAEHAMKYFEVRRGKDRTTAVEISAFAASGMVGLYLGAAPPKALPSWDPATSEVVGAAAAAETWGGGSSLTVTADEDLLTSTLCPDANADCSFVAAVLGLSAQEGGSAFQVLATAPDTATLVVEGVPLWASNEAKIMRYFRATVVEPNADLSIAVTPIAGDPDIFVSAPGADPPTVLNSTWASARFGGDSLQVQAEDMATYCDPLMGPCDYIIGINSWSTSVYTLQVAMGRGWQRPLTLVAGQPQVGRVGDGEYAYYQMTMPDAGAGGSAPRVAITVTPTDGGDTDVFVTASRDREPGQHSYDVRSQAWTGSDVAVFAEGAPNYCTGCTLYIAVKGFRGGAFSITGEVDGGLTLLQAGLPVAGAIVNGTSRYYVLHSPESADGIVEVRLTSLTGDSNLYVNAGFGAELPGPGQERSHWSSEKKGDDAIQALPTDAHYCSGCDYVIGVHAAGEGALNTTFTLEATIGGGGGGGGGGSGGGGGGGGGGIVTLVHGRPQNGRLSPSSSRCYSIALVSDAETLALTLTTLSGAADMYLVASAAADASGAMPNPGNPASYDMTTKGEVGGRAGSLMVEGAGTGEPAAFIVCVWSGAQDSEYSIVAGYSQKAVMLQAGVPQRHFVQDGAPELFEYLVTSPEEDVQITVTPISGDPDVFVEWGGNVPLCHKEETGYACGNWTWASTDKQIDTIFIDHAHPCDRPDQSPHMVVTDSCDPATAYGAGPLAISIYGYEDTQFTIVATPVGRVVSLAGGMSQHGSTSTVVTCARRDDAGMCPPGASDGVAQAAYYVFEVNDGDVGPDTPISITVAPVCDDGGSSAAACVPGCPCSPLSAFVKSCRAEACVVEDMYPDDKHNDAQFKVDASSTPTVFIARDPMNPYNGHCVPRPGARGTCRYFIAVVSGTGAAAKPGRFSIDASTADSVSVLPCRVGGTGADGVHDAGAATVGTPANSAGPEKPGAKRYEGCAVRDAPGFRLSVETCSGGGLELMVLDGTYKGQFPEGDVYQFRATETEMCSTDSAGKHHCSPADTSLPTHVDVVRPASDAFYISVSGIGSYRLRRLELGNDGRPTAPSIYPSTQGSSPPLSVAHVTADAAALSWRDASITFGAEKRNCDGRCRFATYAAPLSSDDALASAVLGSPCGAEAAAAAAPRSVVSAAWTAAQSDGRMNGLRAGTEYSFVVVARCDFACMGALFPTRCVTARCSTLSVAYPVVSATTRGGGGGAETSNVFKKVLRALAAAVVAVAALAAVALGVAARRRRAAAKPRGQQVEFAARGPRNFPQNFQHHHRGSFGGSGFGDLDLSDARPLMAEYSRGGGGAAPPGSTQFV